MRLCLSASASWFDRKLPGNLQGQTIQAPEVVLDAKWDHKIDIWQVGLLVSTHPLATFERYIKAVQALAC